MINVTVTGESLADCHQQILSIAEEVRAFKAHQEKKGMTSEQAEAPVQAVFHPPHVPLSPVGPAIPQQLSAAEVAFKNQQAPAPIQQGAEVTVDKRGVPHLPDVHSGTKEVTVKGAWRKRRGVDDVQLAQAEAPYLQGVAIASEPIAPNFAKPTPPVPTSAVHVKLPDAGSVLGEMNLAPVMPPLTPPTPEQVEHNTYDLVSFKANIVPILNKLADEGKIDHTWINQTKTQAFGNKEIYDWHKDAAACEMLFIAFIDYKFITEL